MKDAINNFNVKNTNSIYGVKSNQEKDDGSKR